MIPTNKGVGLGSHFDGLERRLVGQTIDARIEAVVEDELCLLNRRQAEHRTRRLGDLHHLGPRLVDLARGVDTDDLALALALGLLEQRADKESSMRRPCYAANDKRVEEEAESLLLRLDLEQRAQEPAGAVLVERGARRDIIRLQRDKIEVRRGVRAGQSISRRRRALPP
jgi:hypothetical protein